MRCSKCPRTWAQVPHRRRLRLRPWPGPIVRGCGQRILFPEGLPNNGNKRLKQNDIRLFDKRLGAISGREADALGATIRGINIRDLKRVPVPVPPKLEQIDIARFLDEKAAKLEQLSTKVRQAIDHLTEYRTALISAAVTGKIDVREEVVSR